MTKLDELKALAKRLDTLNSRPSNLGAAKMEIDPAYLLKLLEALEKCMKELEDIGEWKDDSDVDGVLTEVRALLEVEV